MTKWLRGRNVSSCLIVVYVQGIIHISCNNDTPIFLHLLSWLNAQIQYEQMLIKFWLWVNYINLLISEILWLIDFKTCKRNKCIPTKMFFFAASPLVTPSYCNIFHEWLWMWLMWENLFLHHLHQSVVGGNCLYSSVDHAIGLAVKEKKNAKSFF